MRGNVDGVFPERSERHDVESPFMGRRQHYVRGGAVAVSAQPVRRGHAPAFPWHEPGEPELRPRRAESVADTALMLEELSGHHRADRVAALILGPGVAAPISIEPGDRIGTTRLQLTTQHIALDHPSSIAHRLLRRAALGDRRDDVVREVPGMHQQRPGHLADRHPQWRQYLFAIPPGSNFISARTAAEHPAEMPGVPAVTPPSRQPSAQFIRRCAFGPAASTTNARSLAPLMPWTRPSLSRLWWMLAELNRAPTASAATAWPASCQAVRTVACRAGAKLAKQPQS